MNGWAITLTTSAGKVAGSSGRGAARAGRRVRRPPIWTDMIQLQNLKFSIGQRVLFQDLNWVLAPGDRCALVGPNGAGKTTLIRVMLGELAPDSGARVMARGTRLGY